MVKGLPVSLLLCVYHPPKTIIMKRFSTFLFVTFFLFSFSGMQNLVAQERTGHEVSAFIRGGVSTLHYNIDKGRRSSGFGTGAGVNYTWFFQPRWGLQTGIEWQGYSTHAWLDPQEFRKTLEYEDHGHQGIYQMDFVSNVKNFSEKQRAGYLQVPLLLQYQTGARHIFYAAAGIKAGIRLYSNYKGSADMNNYQAYGNGYPIPDGPSAGEIEWSWGYEWKDDPDWNPEEFLGTRDGYSFNGRNDLKFSVLGSLELGMKWRLAEHLRLYTGLYADMGINNVKNPVSDGIMEYVPAEWNNMQRLGDRSGQEDYRPAEYKMNSVINTDTHTSSVRPLAFGIKVGIAFGLKRHKHVEYVPPVIVEEDPADKARRALDAFVPELEYIAPAYEEVKARKESGSSFIDFAVNNTDINSDYRNNRVELAKIDNTLKAVRSNRFATITDVSVIGYASPEGSYELNTRLAAGRVESLVEYLKETGDFRDVKFSTSSVAEDWEGLEKMVAASDMAYKEAVLEIVRDKEIKDNDLREARLRQIAGGGPYRELLEKIYPGLRRTDYTISYTIRNFTLEESKALFQNDPRQLSLEEMYRVALTFESGSDEFIKVFEKAVMVYPDDPVSNLNAANAALMRKDADAARKYLVKAQEGREKELAQEALRKIDGWLEVINGK